MTDYRAFEKPDTLLNRLLANVSAPLPSTSAITWDRIDQWLEHSAAISRRIVAHPGVIDKVVNDTDWGLSYTDPPKNTWFGEALFAPGTKPRATIYAHSTTAKLLPKFVFTLAGQAGMDHLFGHLYAFHAGHPDYGEEVACAYQHAVARARGGIWTVIASLIPPIYKLHKNIPKENYGAESPARVLFLT